MKIITISLQAVSLPRPRDGKRLLNGTHNPLSHAVAPAWAVGLASPVQQHPGRLASEAQWNELSRAKLCASGFWESHKGGVWPKAWVIFQLCHVQHFICGVTLYLFLQPVSPSERGKVEALAWLGHCGVRAMRTALTLAKYWALKSDPAHSEGCSSV